MMNKIALLLSLFALSARADFQAKPYVTTIGGTGRADVSSAEYGYLSGLTANVQTQINSIPGATYPQIVPNSATPNIRSDSDTGLAFPSDGLVDMFNNNVKTTEFQPGLVKFNVNVQVPALVLPVTGSNLFFAGPLSGVAATPAFRAIGLGDVPSSAIPYPLLIPVGGGISIRDNGDGDTGYDFPSDGVIDTYANGVLTQETVAGLNTFIGGVTVTGDLNVGGNIGFPVQNANKVFAGPASGSDAIPTFRALVADDIPAIDISTSTHVTGVLAIGNGGTGANNIGPNGSIPFHNTDNTLATDFDAMNWNIAGRYLQLRNYYLNGDHTDEGNVQIGTINGTLTSTTAAINSNVGTIQRNLNGLFNVVQGPAYSDNLNGVTASTVLGRGVYLNVNSASQIGLMKTDENAINISADSQIDTLEVRTTTPTLNGSLGNVTLEKIQPNIGSSLSISGSLIGKDISLGGVTAPAIAGLRIQAGGDNNHATNSFTRVQALNASGESFSFSTQSTPFASAPGGGVDTLNSFNTLLQLPPGSAPMAYGDVIGLGQSMILAATTSIPPGSAGIGISSVAYADIFSVAAGVTVPEFNGALAAVVNLNLGADGGNLDQFNGWKFRGIFQAGGTSTFDKGVGLYLPNGACAGFSSCYPVKSDDPDAHIVTAGLINGASPTELSYLSGLTANVQTQINSFVTGSGFVLITGDTMTGALTVPELHADSLNTNSGKVGIGTPSPLHLLDVSPGANQHFMVQAPILLADGITIASTDDAESVNLGVEIRGVPIQLTTSGGPTSPIILAPDQVEIARFDGTGLKINTTASRVVVSSAGNYLASSGITTTELDYLSGLGSNVQTQLNTLSTNLNDKVDRTGDILTGALTDTATVVSLTADDQLVSISNVQLMVLNSDNATPTNRTFTLGSAQDGLHITFIWDSANAGELLDGSAISGGGTLKLDGDWIPNQDDTLSLICRLGAGLDCYETSRSAN